VLAAAAPSFAIAEDNNRLIAIQASCNEMQAKIIAGDPDAGLKFVFPKLVQLVGGPEKMAALLRKGAEQVQQLGAKMTCSPPTQVSQVGTRILALVPVLTTAAVVDKERGKGVFKQWSSALAISENQGSSWYFLTVTDKGVPAELLSGGIGNISIPPKDRGTFVPD
jgi:hypothetical protein